MGYHVPMIYADSLFALNMAIDYFLLLCAAKVSGAELNRRRFLLAAALGGAYALGCVLPGMGFLSGGAVKLAAAGLMAVIAYGGETRLLRCLVVFLGVSAAFAGAVFAFAFISGSPVAGTFYVPVSLRVLAVSFALCYAAVSLVFRRLGRRAEREIVGLTVSLAGREARLRALRDTGNSLADPVSGRAVAVAELSALGPLFPPGRAPLLPLQDPAGLCRALSELPGFAGRVTLVPYSSLGSPHGLLAAIRPDSVLTDGGEKLPLLIAVATRPLGGDGGYNAIL